MRRSLAALLGLLTLAAAGCGQTNTRSQADQDRDAKVVANALRAEVNQGSGFKMDHQVQLTGGDIPSGQAFQVHATVDGGTLRQDTARFAYRIQQGKQQVTFDMIVADGQLFARPHGGGAWKATSLPAVSTLITALRLELGRETVLLARSISAGSVTHVDAGFARKYVIRPAPDQLEQLEAVPLQGGTEEQFLRSATAEVDVFLVVPGNRLGRVEVHLTGTDPQTGSKQKVDSVLDVKAAKVNAAIEPPADAQPVDPSGILDQ